MWKPFRVMVTHIFHDFKQTTHPLSVFWLCCSCETHDGYHKHQLSCASRPRHNWIAQLMPTNMYHASFTLLPTLSRSHLLPQHSPTHVSFSDLLACSHGSSFVPTLHPVTPSPSFQSSHISLTPHLPPARSNNPKLGSFLESGTKRTQCGNWDGYGRLHQIK